MSEVIRSKIMKSNSQFWIEKFKKNKARDRKKTDELIIKGWRVLTLWECVLGKKSLKEADQIMLLVLNWLTSRDGIIEIPEKS